MRLTRISAILIMTFVFAAGLATARRVEAGAGSIAAQQSQPPARPDTPATLGTAFTYQGELKKGTTPVTGSCNFHFSLWNAASGGIQIGGTQALDNVTLTNGRFTVSLDFGSNAFPGDARWLAIAVECSGDSSFNTLAPRQPLMPAPYAQYSSGNWSLKGNSGTSANNFLGTTDNTPLTLSVNNTAALRIVPAFYYLWGALISSPNIIGGSSSNVVSSTGANGFTVIGATIGGGGSADGPNRVTGSYGTISGGADNTAAGVATVSGGGSNRASNDYAAIGGGAQNIVSGTYATVSGGFQNVVSGTGAFVGGGGYDGTTYGGNHALANGSVIGGGISNTIQIAGTDAVIGGGAGNTSGASLSTISGGGSNYAGWYATVGGGISNQASGDGATVGGGEGNQASVGDATIGGGYYNQANGGDATVGGGVNNQANGDAATVGGGSSNQADGFAATIPGGELNTASMTYTLAAGYRAKALHQGSFVWADSSNVDFASTGNNQFFVRASGGVYFFASSAGFGGGYCYLAANGTGWTCSSDRNLKENVTAVDSRAVLTALARTPITRWNMKGSTVPHIGPMAQDFYAAFGVGEDDTHINSVDAQGVALAAIQGLYQMIQEKDQHIARLENEVAQLKNGSPRSDQSFNPFNLISVIALGGVIAIGLRKRGARS